MSNIVVDYSTNIIDIFKDVVKDIRLTSKLLNKQKMS